MNRLPLTMFLLASLILSTTAAGGLEDRLPSDTRAMVSWAGRGLTYDGSLLGQALSEPSTVELLKAIRGAMKSETDLDCPWVIDGKNLCDPIWEMSGVAWQHPIVLATAGGADEELPYGIFLIDLGKDLPEFQKHLENFLTEGDLDEKFKTAQTGNATFRVSENQLAFGFDGTVFFMVASESNPSDPALGILQQKPAESLTANKTFLKRMAAVDARKADGTPDENTQMAYYVDVKWAIEKTRQTEEAAAKKRAETKADDPSLGDAPETAPPPFVSHTKKVTDAMGLAKVSALAGSLRFVEKELHTKVRLFSPRPHTGLLLPLDGPALTDADLSVVPADADYMIAGKVSPSKTYAEFKRVATEIEPEFASVISGMEGTFEAELGPSLQKDILDTLGDTWVLCASPSQGGSLLGAVLTVTVKDEKTLTEALEKIGQSLSEDTENPDAPSRMEVFKSGDVNIRYYRDPKDESSAFLLPAWTIYKGRLYLAAYPQIIASALENKTPTLTSTKAFKRLRTKVSPKAAILQYVNTPQIARKSYQLNLLIGTLLRGSPALSRDDDNPFASMKRPWPGSLPTMTKHLRPAISSIVADDAGITLESRTGAPMMPFIGGESLTSFGIFAAIVVPMFSEVSEETDASYCYSNMATIRAQSELHRAMEGSYPTSTQQLVDKDLIADLPTCPEGGDYIFSIDENDHLVVTCPNGH